MILKNKQRLDLDARLVFKTLPCIVKSLVGFHEQISYANACHLFIVDASQMDTLFGKSWSSGM